MKRCHACKTPVTERWRDTELDYLKRFFCRDGAKIVSKMLGKREKDVLAMAGAIGLYYVKKIKLKMFKGTIGKEM